MSFSCCYKEDEYKRVLLDLTQLSCGGEVPEVSFALVVLPALSHQFYFIDCQDYS